MIPSAPTLTLPRTPSAPPPTLPRTPFYIVVDKSTKEQRSGVVKKFAARKSIERPHTYKAVGSLHFFCGAYLLLMLTVPGYQDISLSLLLGTLFCLTGCLFLYSTCRINKYLLVTIFILSILAAIASTGLAVRGAAVLVWSDDHLSWVISVFQIVTGLSELVISILGVNVVFSQHNVPSCDRDIVFLANEIPNSAPGQVEEHV